MSNKNFHHPVLGELVLCFPDDSRLGSDYGGSMAWEQSEDGPLMIVVPRAASDDKCERIATRWGLLFTDVISFRDSPQVAVRLNVHATKEAKKQ